MQKIILIIVCCCFGAVLSGQPNITRVEYFFNDDPGFGNATSITVPTASNIANFSSGLPIGSLPSGLNTLFIRSRDANGKWSVSNRFLFVKISASASPPNITKAEYFVDNDPGFGNATNIPISAAPDIPNIPAAVPLNALSDGLHFFCVRSRDASGRWSVTNRFLFVKISSSLTPPNIITAEYYIDSDPGFGNATPISVTPVSDASNIAVNVNINATSEGLHTLFLRSKDASGRWSVTSRWLFVKIAAGTPDITQVEYYIDADPGFGNAVPVAINPHDSIPNYVSPVNITGLLAGNHRLFIRSRNANGKWSVTNKIEFPIASLVATPFININGITKKIMCGDNSFKVSFHATGTYNPGNNFTVQLSNAAGSFASPTSIGTKTATTSSIIDCKLPLHIANGNAYRVRVVSSSPSVTGTTSDTVFTLFDQPRYNDTTVNIICQAETINLTTVYNTTGFTTSWNTGNPAVAPAGIYQLISANTNLCQDTSIVTVKQDVAVWTGIVSNNWHTPGNWSTGKVPYEKTHVIISTGTPNSCVLSVSDVSVASVQVKTGAIFNVINSRQVAITAKCNPLPLGP